MSVSGPITGSTTEIVKNYYNYLQQLRYTEITLNRADHLLFSSFEKEAAWGMVLIITFFLLAYGLNRVHRKQGELYEPTSFAGSIIERNGKVSWFTWWLIGGLFIAVLYESIRFLVKGYIY